MQYVASRLPYWKDKWILQPVFCATSSLSSSHWTSVVIALRFSDTPHPICIDYGWFCPLLRQRCAMASLVALRIAVLNNMASDSDRRSSPCLTRTTCGKYDEVRTSWFESDVTLFSTAILVRALREQCVENMTKSCRCRHTRASGSWPRFYLELHTEWQSVISFIFHSTLIC